MNNECLYEKASSSAGSHRLLPSEKGDFDPSYGSQYRRRTCVHRYGAAYAAGDAHCPSSPERPSSKAASTSLGRRVPAFTCRVTSPVRFTP